MKGPSVKQARAVLAEHGERGWIELVRTYGKTWEFQGSKVTADPELVHAMLSEPGHTVSRPLVYKFFGKIPGTDGILFKEEDAWRERLRAMMPVFNRSHVDGFAESMGRTLVDHFATLVGDERRHVDLFDEFMRANLGMIMRVGYGLEQGSPAARRIGEKLYDYKRAMMITRNRIDGFGLSLDLIPRVPRIMLHWRKLGAMARDLGSELEAVAGEPEPMSWLARLASTSLSHDEITAEANHLYGAFNAFDVILTCAMHELCSHPEWIERLGAERREVMGERDVPTRDDLGNMPVMKAVMREVLRRYPVSLSIARQVGDEPIETEGGARLEAGDQVLVLLHALHHDPEQWDDPFAFDPGRFLEMSEERYLELSRGQYVPFLYGRRRCIGRELAELGFAACVSAVLANFEFELEHERFGFEPYMIPRPNPLPFTVSAREVAS